MRAEGAAALANFMFVLLLTLGLTAAEEFASRGDAVVYAHPYQYAAYVGGYGLLGVAVGLVLGFLLWLSANLVLSVCRRAAA